MQTLKKALPSKLEFKFFFPNDKGHLLGQRMQSAGTLFDLFSLLFKDDGAFVFQSRKDMEDAAQTIHDHFAKFGLQMHIGSSTKRSKREAIYFHPTLKKAVENTKNLNPS